MWHEISKTGPKPAFDIEGKYCRRFFVGRRYSAVGWVWSTHEGTTEYFWDNTMCAPDMHQIGSKWTHWLAVPAIITEGDEYDPEISTAAGQNTKRRRVSVPRLRAKPTAPKKRLPLGGNARRNLRRGTRG